jgi:mRNA interferase RelE/StbE
VLTVIYKKDALKALMKVQAQVRQRMVSELNAIAADPRGYRGDWKPLTGSPFWRLRVGSYRAVCDIQGDTLVLLVLKVGPRGDVYK